MKVVTRDWKSHGQFVDIEVIHFCIELKCIKL